MRRSLSQAYIKFQLKEYVTITQENTEDYLQLLDKHGYCYSFSLCRSAMRYMGKLDWWKAAIIAVANWDRKMESLKKEIHLPGDEASSSVLLETIFEQVLHYIVFNQAHQPYYPHADFNQYNFLRPGGLFMLLKEKQEFYVTDNYTAAGHFTYENLIRLLQEEDTSRAIQNNICLIYKPGHACELSYDGHIWGFYNPNCGKAILFDDLSMLVKEIQSVLGEDIAIGLVYLGTKTSQYTMAVDPFRWYNELLSDHPEKLIEQDGLNIILHFPHIIPELFANLKKNNKMDCLKLNETNKYGLTPLMRVIEKQHVAAIMSICEAGANPNQIVNGCTPLMLAIDEKNKNIITVLCEAGALPNQIVNGWTPLKRALNSGDIEIIDFFLDTINPDKRVLENIRMHAQIRNKTDIADLIDKKLDNLSQVAFPISLSL